MLPPAPPFPNRSPPRDRPNEVDTAFRPTSTRSDGRRADRHSPAHGPREFHPPVRDFRTPTRLPDRSAIHAAASIRAAAATALDKGRRDWTLKNDWRRPYEQKKTKETKRCGISGPLVSQHFFVAFVIFCSKPAVGKSRQAVSIAGSDRCWVEYLGGTRKVV